MRTLPVLATALAMAFTTSAFAAPAGLPDQPNTTPVTAETMQEVAGTYGLADGRLVRLFILDDRLYAEINGRERFELLAVADHVFATRNNAVTVEFNVDASSADQIRLRYEGDLKAAARCVVAAKDSQAI